MYAAVFVATIFYDMFAAFGCMSATLVLLVVGSVLAAARLGYAPRTVEFLARISQRREEPVVFRDTDPGPERPAPKPKAAHRPPPDLD